MTAFVPKEFNASDPAPMKTVTVMPDAQFILSAGASNDGGGAAYVWDWRNGFQKTKQTRDSLFLSSLSLQTWRMVVLGSEDGFSTVWNWGTGTRLALPYNAHTAKDVADQIAARIKAYFENNLQGVDRLVV